MRVGTCEGKHGFAFGCVQTRAQSCVFVACCLINAVYLPGVPLGIGVVACVKAAKLYYKLVSYVVRHSYFLWIWHISAFLALGMETYTLNTKTRLYGLKTCCFDTLALKMWVRPAGSCFLWLRRLRFPLAPRPYRLPSPNAARLRVGSLFAAVRWLLAKYLSC